MQGKYFLFNKSFPKVSRNNFCNIMFLIKSYRNLISTKNSHASMISMQSYVKIKKELIFKNCILNNKKII
jgi:hypothetical protein